MLQPPVEPAQYTALAFTEQPIEAGISGSIGTVGDALMEFTIGLYKTECISTRTGVRNWSGRLEVERDSASCLHWYNTARVHSSIAYDTPIESEARYAETPTRRVEVT